VIAFWLTVLLTCVAVLARRWAPAGRSANTLRVAVWLGALACVLFGLAMLLGGTAAAQEAPQTAYTTNHPGKNYPWLGLATPDGRYEVLLDAGCDALGADMNVLLARSDDSNEATWSLQLSDGDQVCSVAEWHWMGNLPCASDADGVCDIANA
jgi:hypothetical protein